MGTINIDETEYKLTDAGWSSDGEFPIHLESLNALSPKSGQTMLDAVKDVFSDVKVIKWKPESVEDAI